MLAEMVTLNLHDMANENLSIPLMEVEKTCADSVSTDALWNWVAPQHFSQASEDTFVGKLKRYHHDITRAIGQIRDETNAARAHVHRLRSTCAARAIGLQLDDDG